jgi:hypothetical protein
MPPLRRMGRPGLIGVAARTAVVAGTASATAGAVNRHQANKQQEQQQQAYDAQQQQLAAQQAAAPAAAPQDELTNQLVQLAQLHQQGILDDAEFAAAKAKLLG